MLEPNSSRVNVSSRGGCRSVSVLYPISMMLAGVVGNALALAVACGAYRARANKRKRPFLLCVGSLALADLCGQLLTSPVVIAVYTEGMRWERLDPSGRLCAFFGVCMTAFGLCSLLLAGAMAVERTLAITSPHWYAGRMSPGATRLVLAGAACVALLFALLPLAGLGRYSLQWPGTWCFISTSGPASFAATFALLGVAALLATVACNAVTVRALLLRKRRRDAAGSRSGPRCERLTVETVVQLVGVTCVLCACWSPLLILMLKMILTETSSEDCKSAELSLPPSQDMDCDFFLTAIRMASLNQILDPWVYLLLREILLRKFCQVANAVTNCSREGHKEAPTALDDLNKQTLQVSAAEKQ